jgi:hypothetical protein
MGVAAESGALRRLEGGREDGDDDVCVPLHPDCIGQPMRIKYLNRLLSYISTHNDVWLATGREIVARLRA